MKRPQRRWLLGAMDDGKIGAVDRHERMEMEYLHLNVRIRAIFVWPWKMVSVCVRQ